MSGLIISCPDPIDVMLIHVAYYYYYIKMLISCLHTMQISIHHIAT